MFNDKLFSQRHLQCDLFSLSSHTLQHYWRGLINILCSAECIIWRMYLQSVEYLSLFCHPVSCSRIHWNISVFSSTTLEVIVHLQFPSVLFIYPHVHVLPYYVLKPKYLSQTICAFCPVSWVLIYSHRESDFFYFFYSGEKIRLM